MTELRKIKISDLCTIEKGKIGIKKAIPGQYPLVVTAEKRLTCNECHFDKPSVIIPLVSSTGHGHASLKRIHYQEGKFAVGSILCTVTPKNSNILDAYFLYKFLDLYKEKLLVSRMKGMANVTLPMREIGKIEIPLISIEDQRSWINSFKITHKHITHFDTEITNQQDYLKKLRQTILQEAIQGKLTAEWRKQNPNVEPASELLKKIKAEKEKLIKEKKIKKQKLLPPIKPEEIPFEIPEIWQWCRLGDWLKITDSGWSPACKKNPAPENIWGVLKTTSVQPLCYLEYENKELPSKLMGNPQYEVNEGDILITRAGPANRVGISCLVKKTRKKLMISDKIIRLHSFDNLVFPTFIVVSLNSGPIIQMMEYKKGGMAQSQVNISQNNLKTILIPLPPLSEQKEIASRVEKLMSYCDELEEQINKTQKYSESLMLTVLKEAFER